MKRWRKLFTVSLAVLLLFSSVAMISAEEIKQEQSTLLLVPLDDRPANVYFPQKVGASAGIEVIPPPKEMTGKFTQPGNGDEISKWLVENGDQADGFVISTSMLAYGGLVASRIGVKSLEEATKDIQVIKELKKLYPEKPVYIFDTI